MTPADRLSAMFTPAQVVVLAAAGDGPGVGAARRDPRRWGVSETAGASAELQRRWPGKRCVALGAALGFLAVTIIAVVTTDAASAALGGAFTVFLALLTAAPVWEADHE